MKLRKNDISLAYEDAGSGEPALLLVHGWAVDRSVLQPHPKIDRFVQSLSVRG
jgi:pimeloyl-ACP methyl ester carboxylesterase